MSRGCSSVGRALHSHCRGQGFESPQLHGSPLVGRGTATLAQLVEHVTRNDGVVGSSPTGGSPAGTLRAPAGMEYGGFDLAGVAQLAEHQLPKLRVAGSSPVSRSGSHCPLV